MPDSMVHGPYSDFRLMAANRLVTDQNVRALLWEKHAWQGIADKERERGDSLAVALDLTKLAGGKLVEGNLELRQNLMDCGGRNAQLQGWATVGKVGTATVAASLLTVVAVLVARSLP